MRALGLGEKDELAYELKAMAGPALLVGARSYDEKSLKQLEDSLGATREQHRKREKHYLRLREDFAVVYKLLKNEEGNSNVDAVTWLQRRMAACLGAVGQAAAQRCSQR